MDGIYMRGGTFKRRWRGILRLPPMVEDLMFSLIIFPPSSPKLLNLVPIPQPLLPQTHPPPPSLPPVYLGFWIALTLDAIVRTVPQYRLYATSLLFLYDGATQDEIDALDEETSGIQYSRDVRVKIVDFAHAITDLHTPDVITAPFPPSHPRNADRGYLKGLASLKSCFKTYAPPPHPPLTPPIPRAESGMRGGLV